MTPPRPGDGWKGVNKVQMEIFAKKLIIILRPRILVALPEIPYTWYAGTGFRERRRHGENTTTRPEIRNSTSNDSFRLKSKEKQFYFSTASRIGEIFRLTLYTPICWKHSCCIFCYKFEKKK